MGFPIVPSQSTSGPTVPTQRIGAYEGTGIPASPRVDRSRISHIASMSAEADDPVSPS